VAAGTRLDRYELVRRVASGGMGAIWEGRFGGKHGFERRVAIKTILPHLSASPSIRTMFLEEARVGSKLAHANVAQILDVGDVDDIVYIVFEWVDGAPLESLCRRAKEKGERLPPAFALHVLADVCAGLEAAHALGIVHRDVNPRNILVSDQGFAKLIDFGIAKARDRLCKDTRSGVVRGTPEYMSPEQACGAPLDGRSDLWSVAAVLHRALLGVPPFAPDAFPAFVGGTRHLELPATLEPDLRHILSRGLARGRDDRFAGADEMRVALLAAAVARDDGRTMAQWARELVGRAPPTTPGSTESVTRPEGNAPEVGKAKAVATPDPLAGRSVLSRPRRDRWTPALRVALVVAVAAAVVALGLALASLAS
jgi:eukaryotic-like serine/threonine-protein kinase